MNRGSGTRWGEGKALDYNHFTSFAGSVNRAGKDRHLETRACPALVGKITEPSLFLSCGRVALPFPVLRAGGTSAKSLWTGGPFLERVRASSFPAMVGGGGSRQGPGARQRRSVRKSQSKRMPPGTGCPRRRRATRSGGEGSLAKARAGGGHGPDPDVHEAGGAAGGVRASAGSTAVAMAPDPGSRRLMLNPLRACALRAGERGGLSSAGETATPAPTRQLAEAANGARWQARRETP
jgi:hypothetical protein